MVYPIARGTGPMLSSIGAIHPAARDADLAGHLRAARGRRRNRLHHHAGRSFRVPPTARPRWRALGTATGSLIAGYTVVDGYGVKMLGIHPVVLDWVTNSAALLHHAADRAVERASRASEDEGLLAAGILGSARCRRCPTSSCCQAIEMGAPLSLVAPAREMSMMVARAVRPC